jgi:hypothetical protein
MKLRLVFLAAVLALGACAKPGHAPTVTGPGLPARNVCTESPDSKMTSVCAPAQSTTRPVLVDTNLTTPNAVFTPAG